MSRNMQVLSETERSYRLTREERLRWRELITHESTLRRELARSSTREDFTRVAHDHRFAPLYAPPKWEVIIRILAPPPDKPKVLFYILCYLFLNINSITTFILILY